MCPDQQMHRDSRSKTSRILSGLTRRGMLLAVLPFGQCDGKPPPAREVRPVRYVVVEARTLDETVSLTGRIAPRDEVSLAFRTPGRMIERLVDIGGSVTPGQVVARLDAAVQQNALSSAEASVKAAQGQLTQLSAAFERQRSLLASGFTTRAQYDLALQQMQTAQSQVEAASAQLRTAGEQLAYTNLVSDVSGSVVAKGAEPGEVVAAGQMIVRVAGRDGRDAVFDVPAAMLREVPRSSAVTVALTDDPKVETSGAVREVSPSADPVTRSYQVKIALNDPPAAFRLGAVVSGSVRLPGTSAISIPASALTQSGKAPAVWIIQRPDMTVSLRPVTVERYDTRAAIVSGGLASGDLVVTAGVQALYPGQKVRLLDAGG